MSAQQSELVGKKCLLTVWAFNKKTPGRANFSFYGTLTQALFLISEIYDAKLYDVSVYEGDVLHVIVSRYGVVRPSDPDSSLEFVRAHARGVGCPFRVGAKGDCCERHHFKPSPKPARTGIAGIPYRRCNDDACFSGCEPDSFHCKKHTRLIADRHLEWDLLDKALAHKNEIHRDDPYW